MFIKFYLIILLVILSVVFGLIGIGGWIREVEKRKKAETKSRRFAYENNMLRSKLRRITAINNIKEADEYGREGN